MLTIHVLERSAEDRENLVRWLQGLLHEDTPEIEYVPRVDIRPIPFEEIKFHGTPDICFVGPMLLEYELTQLGKIRKCLPTTPIVACTSERLESLAQVEQMARLGATDTLSLNDNAGTLLRKLLLLSKNKGERDGGKLIVVDSGKGGVGVTSLAASLAELAALDQKKTVLVDFDFETQDLSRFLQSRPFVNENLQLLLEGGRILSDEIVDQCISKVWEDDEYLYHVAPPPESDALYASDTKILRILLSFFEVLDEKFDCIIVDAGSVRGAMQKTLYRAADHIVFVLNNDPATLYSSVDRLKKIQEILSPTAELTVVDNGGQYGLPRKMLLSEFSRAARIDDAVWHPTGIPFCKNGAKWPASGGSFVALARQAGREAIEALAGRLGLIEQQSGALGLFRQMVARLSERIERSGNTPAQTISGVSESEKQVLSAGKERKALPLLREDAEEEQQKSQDSLLDLVTEESEEALSEKGEQECSDENDAYVHPEHALGLEVTDFISKATLQ